MAEKAKKSQQAGNAGEKDTLTNPTQEENKDSTYKAIVEELNTQDPQKSPENDYKSIIDDLNDKVLRAMAEAQNTRRRADIDIQNAKNFGIQSFAKDLLGVMDNLSRASETISEEDIADPKLKNIKDGIEITKREMLKVFERSGIKQVVPAIGEVFDPNLHQAISQIPAPGAAAGTILQLLQTGYLLKDRLLRPALVVVCKAD